MQKKLASQPHMTRFESAAAPVIAFGIACCACAMAIVLAIAIAARL